ncbi:MAG TPA: LytTR family DNA-binding domain-containing protein [Cyclobacteriaceae bacterium]|jgi:two-component system LytT family response regulator|nr:LytTR family DNA-binding domain-containing protein [Cyclobacteriaceae bacterium]
MKAILIDDERDALEMLEWIIKKQTPEVDIIALCDSALDGLEKIKTLKPELVFLDIEMPQLNGFDLLERLGTYDFEVIFTTAYNQFAIKALKICALDYLLKPVDGEELKAAVQKALSRKRRTSSEQLEMLMNYFKPEKPKSRRVALTAADHLIFVDTNDIIYCESDSNYTTFYLKKGEKVEKVVISKTLKDVEEILEGADFFRIHASFLINMKHVSKFTRGDGGYVVMSNNQHITVSRKKKDEFFEMFSKL